MSKSNGFDVEKEEAIPHKDMLFSVSDSSGVKNIEDSRLANSVILEKVLMKISKDVDDELVIVKKNSDDRFFYFILLFMFSMLGITIYGEFAGWSNGLLLTIIVLAPILGLVLNIYYGNNRKGIYGNYYYCHSSLLRVNLNKSLMLVSSSVCKGDLDEPGHLLRLTMILANNEHLKIEPEVLLEKIKTGIHRKMTAKLNSSTYQNNVKSLSNDMVLEIKKDVTQRYYDLMCGLYVRRLGVQGREDVKSIRAVITEIKKLKCLPVHPRDKVLKMEVDKFIEESLGEDLREFNRKVLGNFNEGGYK